MAAPALAAADESALSGPPSSTAAWFGAPWTVISPTGSHTIKTKVDTGSDYSMIPFEVAVRLSLKILPLLVPKPLKGWADGRECMVKWVWIELECPLLKVGRATVPMYVSDKSDRMIVGTKLIDQLGVLGKIEEAKEVYGLFPPGFSVDFMAGDDNGIHTIHDDRSNVAKKRDEEVYHRSADDKNFALSSLLRHKQAIRTPTTGTPSAYTAADSAFSALHSSSRTNTSNSSASADSWFSGAEDLASTAATSVFGDGSVKKSTQR